MLIPALARQVEIWPTMFGTLLLAIARRVVFGARGSTASGIVHAVADVAVLEEIAHLCPRP